MIKGLIKKHTNLKTVLFIVDYGNKTVIESLPLHPADCDKEFEQAQIVDFTIIKSWADLDIIYYAKLL